MEKYYLISYDLRMPGHDYSALYDEIKALGEWQHPMESTWVVKSDKLTPSAIRERLMEKCDSNDSLFVIDITTSDYSGWLPKTFWAWYKTSN